MYVLPHRCRQDLALESSSTQDCLEDLSERWILATEGRSFDLRFRAGTLRAQFLVNKPWELVVPIPLYLASNQFV